MLKECKICGNKFDYCGACALTKDPYKNGGYCGESCYHISMELQRYGCHVSTATETVDALKAYNIDKMSLRPNIEKYYKDICNEADAQKPKRKFRPIVEVIPTEDVEVVVKNDEDTTISEIE